MLNLNFRAKLIAGLSAATCVLLLVAFLTYTTLAHNTADRQWVTHTLLVLEHLSDLQARIADAETAERGFVLTANPGYLVPFQTDLSSIPDALRDLRQLTSDNPVQQSNLDVLQPLVLERLALLKKVIDLRTNEGFPSALAVMSAGVGKQRMDEIRLDISTMKGEEDRLLVVRDAELDVSTRRARLFILVGESLAFGLLLLAGALIQQEMNTRRRAEEDIRRLNAELELRVAERTAELSARSKDLERSNMELQQFAYVASHDLQEPLRTISSFTQLLAKRYRSQLDEKAHEFIDFAVDGCKRMQTLINDLLAFSRVGTQGNPLGPVDCDAALDRVLKYLRVAIQESGAEIRREPLPVLLADEAQLVQLLQNLIANAIKFRAPQTPPRIHISAQRRDANWAINIRDNGIGIPAEHRDRIFVIFQRLHNKTEYSGTGIGLAVCKKIAERHGGNIWVEPAPQGGSIFSFTMLAGEITDAHSTQESTHGQLRSSATSH